MPTTTVRGIDLILVGSLGKETLSNDSFENLALGISGTTTIALTATDYTLTTDNQGEAMRMILVLTGTLTANVTVFVPAEGRVFVVDNRTTGAFTVTFTTATGTGFAVPQAERTFLYCDGTDVFPVGTGGGGGGGAPPDAPYLVSSAHSLLTGERVVTDTATVLWDHTTVGQSRATVPAASETAAGVLELATAAETQAGTDTTRAVTPAGLAAKVPSGTALSVARYAASGTALETSPLSIDATNQALLSEGDLTVKRTTASQVTSTIDGLAGQQRVVQWATSGSPRWMLRCTSDAEAGSTAGSNWQLVRRDDTGGNLGAVLHILRSSGLVGVGSTLNATLGSGGAYQQLTIKGSTLYVGQSSVQERPMTLVESTWATSTDASRKGRVALSVYDATAAREGLRIETSGTAPMIGFLGASAVVRQTVPAAATDAATTQTLANSLRSALVNLGLCV